MKSARDRILDSGFSEVMIFEDKAYDCALVGVSEGNRAVYDYDKMVEGLMNSWGFSVKEAIDWISTNTMGTIPQETTPYPIIIYSVEEDEGDNRTEKQ